MSKQIDFIFDFASPNAYLAHKVIGDIANKAGANVHYIPCLLGGIFKSTNNQPPMLAFAEIPAKLAHQTKEIQRFIKRHGLDKFKMNPHFPINTVQLMRAALVTEADGDLPRFIDAMLKAMWEDGLKLDDSEVLHKAISDAGFDGDRIMAQITSDEIKQKLITNTQAAVERGCFGIPTFYIDDEMFFGKDHLHELEYHLTTH